MCLKDVNHDVFSVSVNYSAAVQSAELQRLISSVLFLGSTERKSEKMVPVCVSYQSRHLPEGLLQLLC